jgi:IS605 OrfB family transposase
MQIARAVHTCPLGTDVNPLVAVTVSACVLRRQSVGAWGACLEAGFVGGGWWTGDMPRRRDPQAPQVVYRTARAGLRVTAGQRRRLLALLVSAGDVWACVLEVNAWRRARQDAPLVSYQALCRELALSGPGTFGELDTTGARSVVRRYSDAWFATGKRRRGGDLSARFPRRRRAMVPVRWYHGTFTLNGRRLKIPAARGCPPLRVRLDRELPYSPGQVRSITLLHDAGRLWVDVTAEVPVTAYPTGQEPDPARVAGVDLGIIHPYAVAGPEGEGLLVSGRAVRAEHRMHLADGKGRCRAVARRAPRPGQKGSRRWRQFRRQQRLAETRHRRRVSQAQHEAATAVIGWAVDRRIGTLAVGDPRGVLNLDAGRRHNQRTRDWRIGHLIAVLRDKAEAAGINLRLVDERGTSSTCPACASRVSKPAGRLLSCPACGFTGHRDLCAAASIAARAGGGITPAVPAGVTHRRAGAHLPGVSPSRRDPRRRAHHRRGRESPGRHRPAPPTQGCAGSRSQPSEEPVIPRRIHRQVH